MEERFILVLTNVTNLPLHQLCLRVPVTQTLANTLQGNNFCEKIFGEPLKVVGIPLNAPALDKADGHRIIF
jgi:hypothetical protein